MSAYDPIAHLFDPWSRSVTEDVEFYVLLARAVAPAPVVELGVGTGRIAIPVAAAGCRVIGIDSSPGMLEVCAERARLAGVAELLDLRLGDFCEPPVEGSFPLVTCPFRAYLHLRTDEDRLRAFRAAYDLLEPGGRLVFDVFAPSAEDIADTDRRWIEREPGIWERADWHPERQTFELSVRDEHAQTTMSLAWLDAPQWRALLEQAGFVVDACYGWFDWRPYRGGEDSVWIARRP